MPPKRTEEVLRTGQAAYEFVRDGGGSWKDASILIGVPRKVLYSRAATYARENTLPFPLPLGTGQSVLYTPKGLRLGRKLYWLRWLTGMPWPEIEWEFELPTKMGQVYARTWALLHSYDWPITENTLGPLD